MSSLRFVKAIAVALAFLYSTSCKNKVTKVQENTPTNGTIHISVDESFEPVISEQVKMYEASNPQVNIIPHYKPEAECLRDLTRDTSNRLVIVTRGLDRKEENYFKDSLSYVPHWQGVATDAIALIVHKDSPDTLYTMEELRNMLQGKTARKINIVFDGLRATSTVRFAVDSILKGQPFDTSVVKAVKNSRAVIDYIAATPGAVGMVGISWIGNPEDTAQLKLLKKVKICYVRCERCGDSPYVKPTQASIMEKRYPLVRALYYIVKENFIGTGTGFSNFLQYERGQLIFRRAYLSPGTMNFVIRKVKINERLEKE